MGIDQAHALGLEPPAAEGRDEFGQTKGPVHEVEMSPGPKEPGRGAGDVVKGTEQFVAGNGAGIKFLRFPH